MTDECSQVFKRARAQVKAGDKDGALSTLLSLEAIMAKEEAAESDEETAEASEEDSELSAQQSFAKRKREALKAHAMIRKGG